MITKRQLRRLAYRVPRDPSLRPILHDSLLEVYPVEYERAIANAERWTREDRRSRVIMFNPRAMVSGNIPVARFGTPSIGGGNLSDYVSLFAIYEGPSRRLETELRWNPFTVASVIVYVADPRRKAAE